MLARAEVCLLRECREAEGGAVLPFPKDRFFVVPRPLDRLELDRRPRFPLVLLPPALAPLAGKRSLGPP